MLPTQCLLVSLENCARLFLLQKEKKNIPLYKIPGRQTERAGGDADEHHRPYISTASTQNSKVLVSITAQEGFRKRLGCPALSAARAVEKGFTCQRESDLARLSCE